MPTGHYRFRRSLGNVSSNFRGARPDTYPLLSYVLQGRALDLSNVGSLTILDISGNGNDATLYTGRYVALSTAEYAQFTDPTAFTTTPASVSIYARSADASGVTNVPINWGGTAVGGTIVDNGLWQQVEIDLTGILEATRLDPSVIEIGYDGSDDFIGDLAYAEIKGETDTVLDTIPLNQLDGTYTDGDPCFSTGGRVGVYKGTPIGGIEETTIPQLAGVDFNKLVYLDGVSDSLALGSTIDFGTSDFSATATVVIQSSGVIIGSTGTRWLLSVSTSGASIREKITATIYNFSYDVGTLNAMQPYEITIQRVGDVLSLVVDGVTQTDTEAIPTASEFTANELGTRGTDYFGGFIFDVNIDGQAAWPLRGNDPYTDTIGSNNLTEAGTPSSYLIPESTTAGLDALGNALTFQRPNNAVVNLNGGGYVQLPAIGNVRSVTMAVYWQGDYQVVIYSGTEYVDISLGNIDCLASSTRYVNGVAGSALTLGWNIVGFTFDADTSGFDEAEVVTSHGNLLAYEPGKALTADEHLQNYNAFKSSYGL